MDIYVSDITEFTDLPGVNLLTDTRQARLLRYLRQEDKARCLAAGLMLRRHFGPERAGAVRVTPLGKPYLPEGPHFSLSHSGNKAVLLVSKQEAGVDIEQIGPWSEAVARRVFSERERDWLRTQETDQGFYRLWTGKESIMKALGLGFQLPPESFEIHPDRSGPNAAGGKAWYLQWKELEGHMLCWAASAPRTVPEIIFLTREELIR